MRICSVFYGGYQVEVSLSLIHIFKGGNIWKVIVDINGAVQAIGLALLVLFFVIGMVKTCGSFTDVKMCIRDRVRTSTIFFVCRWEFTIRKHTKGMKNDE